MSKNVPLLFKNFVREQNLIQENDRIIAGISGGADSVCLLFLLSELRKKLNFELFAVHVNHMLRGEESERDEEFVKIVCAAYHVPLTCVKKDVKELSKMNGESPEEAGRGARYKAFADDAKSLEKRGEGGEIKIAVAHHKDDNAETVLLNMIRGSAGAGLKGISALSRVNGLKVIRPMLCLTRKEIREFAEENAIAYVEDSTNADAGFARNKIRLEVMPLLTGINSRALEHINNAAASVGKMQEYLDAQISADYEDAAQLKEAKAGSESSVTLDIKKLKLIKEPVLSGVIYKAIREAANSAKDISRAHVRDVLALLNKQTGRSADLPYGLTAKRSYGKIVIEKKPAKGAPRKKTCGADNRPSFYAEIPKDILSKKKTAVSLGKCGGEITFCLADVSDKNRASFTAKKKYTKAFDYDKIRDTLVLDKAGARDRIRFAGGSKSLKKFFKDEHIPNDERQEIPVLKDSGGVLWVIGRRIGEEYKITEKTKTALVVSLG